MHNIKNFICIDKIMYIIVYIGIGIGFRCSSTVCKENDMNEHYFIIIILKGMN